MRKLCRTKIGSLNHHHYFDPRRFHPDMEYFQSSLTILGLTLTFLFLHFSLWNRLGRSRAPKDVLLLYEEAFPWLVFITVLNLVLLLLELGFWDWLWDLKESRWPRAPNPGPLGRAWGSLSRLWGGLLRTPGMGTYWLSTQLPESLQLWLLDRKVCVDPGQILDRVWALYFWPMLVPALVLNLEVHGSGVLRYFYWSLVLSLIPLGNRLYLSLIRTLGIVTKIQKFRRHQKIKILDVPDFPGIMVQILELIPWDQQRAHLDGWKKSHKYLIQQLYWKYYKKIPGQRIRALRCALLLLAWGSILLWPLLTC